MSLFFTSKHEIKTLRCYKCGDIFKNKNTIYSKRKSCRDHCFINDICIDCGLHKDKIKSENCYHIGETDFCFLCTIS